MPGKAKKQSKYVSITLDKATDEPIQKHFLEMAQIFPDGKSGVFRKAVEMLYRQVEIQAALNALHQARIKK